MKIKQLGFTLIELVFALVCLLTLAVITMPIIYHEAKKMSFESKVGLSLNILKKAASTYYLNQIENQPKRFGAFSIQGLEDSGYLNANDLFNETDNNNDLLSYSVWQPNASRELAITIVARENIQLNNLSPSEIVREDNSKETRYTWYFLPNIDVAENNALSRVMMMQRVEQPNV